MPSAPLKYRVHFWRWRLSQAWRDAPRPLIAAAALMALLVALPTLIALAGPRVNALKPPDFSFACTSAASAAMVGQKQGAEITERCWFGICFEKPTKSGYQKIFGFAEFIAALALLVVLFTLVDVRYRFRVQVAPANLELMAFGLLIFVGLGTLITELWLTEGWWELRECGLTRNSWQAVLGLLFFSTFLTWIYYAFISPPTYGKHNAARFGRALMRIVVRGNEQELAVVCDEISRSATALVKHAASAASQEYRRDRGAVPAVDGYANDILLLMGNRKLCRQIVALSPGTAQAVFSALSSNLAAARSLRPFSMNVSAEAIAQTDSFLYHEGAGGYYSGLLGYIKPVTQAVYGDYCTLSALGFGSPFEISHDEVRTWRSPQWKAYLRAVLVALEDFLDRDKKRDCGVEMMTPRPVLGALRLVESATFVIGRDENYKPEVWGSDGYETLNVLVEFFSKSLKAIEESGTQLPVDDKPRKLEEAEIERDLYDVYAQRIFDSILAVSRLALEPDAAWMIHHNTIWGRLIDRPGQDSAPRKILRRKLFRLMMHSIRELEKWPNFKGSRALGFALNVVGLTGPLKRTGYRSESAPFARWVRCWARRHFYAMREANADVANSVLIGGLTYDEANNRFVFTWRKGLSKEAPRDFLAVKVA